MTFSEFFRVMSKANAEGTKLTGVIVFSQDSFYQFYTEQERSYRVSSMAKYFKDGKYLSVPLDFYVKARTPRWKIEKAYIEEDV